jgi:hypothetical protein
MGDAFLATRMLMDSVPLILLVTVIGTTAPFSAISGALSLIFELSLVLALPSAALSAPSTSLAC